MLNNAISDDALFDIIISSIYVIRYSAFDIEGDEGDRILVFSHALEERLGRSVPKNIGIRLDLLHATAATLDKAMKLDLGYAKFAGKSNLRILREEIARLTPLFSK